MRKLLPHIVASFVFLLCFLAAADAFAQTTTPSLPTNAPIAKTGVVESYLSEPFYRGIGWIAIGIISFFAWLVGLAGVLLNFTVTYLVVGMGEMILKNGFGVAIENLWKLVRDLVNLAFIFALLYLGITTIIQGGTSKVKSALAGIIISMLLVNFSLYFAKAVIDVGNFTAYTIYNVMAKQDGSPGYVTNESIGISGVFADRVGAIQLLTSGNNSVQQRILEQSVSQGTIGFLIVYALGSSIFLFMLAFAFAYGAFLLVVRFVTLIIVMIFAPIAFLPTTVPAMAKLRSRWINTLLTQAFVAPVYLFGFYVTLLVLMHTPWQTETGLAALFSGGNDFTAGFQALLFFVVAIAMLLGTTATAKSMAASGADVSKALTKVTLDNALSRNIRSFAGRRTLGTFASKAGKANDYLEGRKWGRALKGGATIATFGAFNERTRRNLIKKGKTSKFGGSYSYEDDEAFDKQLSQVRSEQSRKDTQKGALKEHFANPADQAKYAAAAKAVGGMTTAELEKQSLDELKKIAGLLSNSQMDKIKDSKELTESDKGEVKSAREGALKARYEAGADQFLRPMKPQDIAKLPKEILLHPTDLGVLPHINGEVLRRIMEDNTLTGADLRKFTARMLHTPGISAATEEYILRGNGRRFYPQDTTVADL